MLEKYMHRFVHINPSCCFSDLQRYFMGLHNAKSTMIKVARTWLDENNHSHHPHYHHPTRGAPPRPKRENKDDNIDHGKRIPPHEQDTVATQDQDDDENPQTCAKPTATNCLKRQILAWKILRFLGHDKPPLLTTTAATSISCTTQDLSLPSSSSFASTTATAIPSSSSTVGALSSSSSLPSSSQAVMQHLWQEYQAAQWLHDDTPGQMHIRQVRGIVIDLLISIYYRSIDIDLSISIYYRSIDIDLLSIYRYRSIIDLLSIYPLEPFIGYM